VVAGAVGWLTGELAVAISGLAAAVLMLGGTAAARGKAYAPLTVEQLLNEQHAVSFRKGVDAGMATRAMLDRSPDQVAQELATAERPLVEDTVLMGAVGAETGPRATLRPCPFMAEDGRRCVLPEHPRKTDHRLEDTEGQE
jgi:hypothetical protein